MKRVYKNSLITPLNVRRRDAYGHTGGDAMAGPIVHLIVQQRMSRPLRQYPPDGPDLAKLLDADPCSPYAGFGSMGPDFLFFSLSEYGTPLDELVNFIFTVYDALEPLIE